jgi:hypothetical protein
LRDAVGVVAPLHGSVSNMNTGDCKTSLSGLASSKASGEDWWLSELFGKRIVSIERTANSHPRPFRQKHWTDDSCNAYQARKQWAVSFTRLKQRLGGISCGCTSIRRMIWILNIRHELHCLPIALSISKIQNHCWTNSPASSSTYASRPAMCV